jgi:hypothetical protein
MNRTARLIITLRCNRKCPYCCNTEEMLSSATRIKDVSCLAEYDEICLSGGEPTLCMTSRIFLYTAKYHRDLFSVDVITLLDGIHYTLHANSNNVDIHCDFSNFQYGMRDYPEKSFRLHVMPTLDNYVPINPSRWNKIETKPWIEDCPLPEHEDLFILES